MGNINATILNIILFIAVAIIANVANKYVEKLKTSLDDETWSKMQIIFDVVDRIVRSIEQTNPNGNGENKKHNAMIMIKNILSSINIKVTDDELTNYIEAAVFDMNNDSDYIEINGDSYGDQTKFEDDGK